MKNADQPAHPVKLTYIESIDLTHEELRDVAALTPSGQTFSGKKSVEKTEDFPGLSKRELIAAMAMQGMLANSFWAEQDVAEQAIRYADKLLKQLES